jgi:hypothetical protein
MSDCINKKNAPGSEALNEPAEVLGSLKDAFLEERAAIESMDQEKLRNVGDTISALFSQLSSLMPSIEAYPHEKVREAASLLREARLLRDENSKLLDQKFYSTGSAVKENRMYLQAHKAYYREDSRSELFLKKNC